MAPTLASNAVPASNEPHADLRTLLLVQKTELVGELAQAMANQFNNIMMAVTSYAELELKKATNKEKRSLEHVLNRATQATVLIQKLLDFSRTRQRSAQQLVLDQILGDIQDLLKELLGDGSDLTLSLGIGSEVIHADRVEVEQTLFALIIIARSSKPAGGKLMVSTSVSDLDSTFIGTDESEPGKYVVLAIENAGTAKAVSSTPSGLDQSDKVNLYLAAVRGIVKSCHGLVRFSSERDASSSLKLYFPVSVREVVQEEGSAPPRNPATTKTILVVEDDDAVRVPAAEFLMMEGFKVLQARTGSEAMNVVQQSRSELDILVTDIVMPRMNGLEVASALLEQHPGLKVLYMSGDPGRSGPSSPANKIPNATLRKPFRLNALRDKIHDLLGE